jgi:hypothetical protein
VLIEFSSAAAAVVPVPTPLPITEVQSASCLAAGGRELFTRIEGIYINACVRGSAADAAFRASVESLSVTKPPPPAPSGGISQARAIELARGHSSLTTFVSVSAGPFRDLNIESGIGPGFVVKPDQLVWAVTFQGDVTICNPLGVCESPRPGRSVVYLDYQTGAFLTSEGTSPAP